MASRGGPRADPCANFGGIDLTPRRPAWMDPAPPPPRPRRFWSPVLERLRPLGHRLSERLAAYVARREDSLGLPAFQGRSWMASEALAFGSSDLFELADDFVHRPDLPRFKHT